MPCSQFCGALQPVLRRPTCQILTRNRDASISERQRNEFYVASSERNRVMARCKSTLASVSETHSKFSCICLAIPCRCTEDEGSWWSVPVNEQSEKCSPFRRERLAASVARGWRTREYISSTWDTVVFVVSSFESNEARIEAS